MVEIVGVLEEIWNADHEVGGVGELLVDQLGLDQKILQPRELLRRGLAPELAAAHLQSRRHSSEARIQIIQIPLDKRRLIGAGRLGGRKMLPLYAPGAVGVAQREQ